MLQERDAGLSGDGQQATVPARNIPKTPLAAAGSPAPVRHPTAAAAAPGPQDLPRPLPGAGGYDRPAPPPGTDPIGSLNRTRRATVEGRVRALEIRPVGQNTVLAVDITDSTGDLTALFYGRSSIPGVICGAKVRFRGQAGIKDGTPVMINPAYELLAPGADQE